MKTLFLLLSFVLFELLNPFAAIAKSYGVFKDELQLPKIDPVAIAATEKILPSVVIVTSEKTFTPAKVTTLGDLLLENQLFLPTEIDPVFFDILVEAPAQEIVRRGSGFIASSTGYIVTNNHVVRDKNLTYTITLQDKTEKKATVIFSDPLNDIALLKTTEELNSHSVLGDSSKLKAGQPIAAIGTVYGRLHNSVSLGEVTDLDRDIIVKDESLSSQNLYDLVESSAYTVPGFSGGPVIDMQGNVIGMNVAAKGVASFFIPINTIKRKLSTYLD